MLQPPARVVEGFADEPPAAAMRALILSLLQPPRPGVDVHGSYKRIALHIHALHAIGACY